jgi:DNA polymerase delta subunit 2
MEQWIAIVSGLNIGTSDNASHPIHLLAEYLTGELEGDQGSSLSAQVVRLLVLGNSLFSHHPTVIKADVGIAEAVSEKKPVSRWIKDKIHTSLQAYLQRRFGNDDSNFSPKPSQTLSRYLLDIARSMPVHILPGPSDPSGTILPQQAFPRAMFADASPLETFNCETNPAIIKLLTPNSNLERSTNTSPPFRTILAHAGQPLDDMFKYVPTPPTTRISLAESTLHWRHIAPTAPDTLWCHPYFIGDPFILDETPDLYLIGNQPSFETRLVKDLSGSARCRIVLVPSFSESGTLVLVNVASLAVRTVRFTIDGLHNPTVV